VQGRHNQVSSGGISEVYSEQDSGILCLCVEMSEGLFPESCFH
jgi:hypothetical protein